MAAAAIPLIAKGLPLLGSAVGGLLGFSSSGRAAKSLSDANIAAEHGVLSAAQEGKDLVSGAVTNADLGTTSANEVGQAKVNEATGNANNALQQGFTGQAANLNPYLTAGGTGVNALAQYATTRPAFSFNPTDLQNDPGYKFQLDQGTQAINNAASRTGLLASGNTLQDLTKYGQGLAGTYYNDAFNRALQTFNTNQNSTLQNLSTLAGIGQTATGQFDQASQNNTNQQAGNTLKAGLFGGQSDIDISKFLSQLGLQGATTEGLFGTQGAKDAGKFAVDAGEANGVGIEGQGNALQSGIASFLKNLQDLMKKSDSGGGGGP